MRTVSLFVGGLAAPFYTVDSQSVLRGSTDHFQGGLRISISSPGFTLT